MSCSEPDTPAPRAISHVPLVVVGCGDHYRRHVEPAIRALEMEGTAAIRATVDVLSAAELRAAGSSVGAGHFVRQDEQPLMDLLGSDVGSGAVFVLNHHNQNHFRDAVELLAAGYQVILEKPYALSAPEIAILREYIRQQPCRLALATYYLSEKLWPFCNLITGMAAGISINDLCSRLGRPMAVFVDLLEGQGLAGRLEHRAAQFADLRTGCGMILDLGVHAISSLLCLPPAEGATRSYRVGSVQAAVCTAFDAFITMHHSVPPHHIPETYAELHMEASDGVIARVRIGKYVFANMNKRSLTIIADKGVLYYDIASSVSWIIDSQGEAQAIPPSGRPKRSPYVYTLLDSLLSLNGHVESPMRDLLALQANELALEAASKANPLRRPRYPLGSSPQDIAQRWNTQEWSHS